MIDRYNTVSDKLSKVFTKEYSTSFYLGSLLFSKAVRENIFKIYGYVRLADEIVDTFDESLPRKELLQKFREDTFDAFKLKISTNPVLHSFQQVVNRFHIGHDLVTAFLDSMEADLYVDKHDEASYNKYIYGSAEVVGLMCLHVFLDDAKEYEKLAPSAKALGSAFQKVNFLRDLNHDQEQLNRSYFPEYNFQNFDEEKKKYIVEDIKAEFNHALEGIKKLPSNSRLGVYVAYLFYLNLLKKIELTPINIIKTKRVRINNPTKYYLISKAYFKYKLNLL
jgi:phytoene/squalene synthetase